MKFRLLACFGALAFVSLPASATAILADGSYHEFLFGGTDLFATSCAGGCLATTNPIAEETSSPPWTFTGSATLTVVDLFAVGDQFEIFDNSIEVGTTSVVAAGGGNPCGGDIGCALANSAYSQGVFDLGAGSHSITIEEIVSPYGSGAAAFSVGTVPEPGTVVLLGAGLAGLWLRRRHFVAGSD